MSRIPQAIFDQQQQYDKANAAVDASIQADQAAADQAKADQDAADAAQAKADASANQNRQTSQAVVQSIATAQGELAKLQSIYAAYLNQPPASAPTVVPAAAVAGP